MSMSFSTSAVDVSLFPYASWAKLYKEVVYNSPALLQRGAPQGEPALRAALARLLNEYRGVRCAPEQVVVGSGMETLMGQLITLFGPQAVYAMEDPGYPAMERALLARGRTVRYVPMDGSGMDADTLAHIFEPYRTTKEQGTGLGLMVCRRIVRAHGGEIDVESKPGAGTTFTVRIPRLEKRVRRLK